jgi:hypothetical protein
VYKEPRPNLPADPVVLAGGGLAGRIRRDAPLVMLDLGIALLSYSLTLLLRFDGSVPSEYWLNFRLFIPFALGTHLLMNQLSGLYGPI